MVTSSPDARDPNDPETLLGADPADERLPSSERARLDELRSYQILDTEPDPTLDGITRAAASLLRTPIALISLVDQDRQWFKSHFGLEATETPRDIAFCDRVVRRHQTLVVEDARSDPEYRDNPLVTGPPNVASYVGVPLETPTGAVLGTLCAIDTSPRRPTHDELEHLRALAAAVMSHLELRKKIRLLQARESMLEEHAYFFENGLDLHCLASTEGRFLSLNRQWTATLGWSLDELKGAPFISFVHPEDVEETLETLRALAGVRTVRSFRNRYRCKDGSYAWLEWNALPNPSGTMINATAREVSHIVAQEQALTRRNAILNLIAEHQRVGESSRINHENWDRILSSIVRVTESEYGFIGLVEHDENGVYLRTTAITDISWDESSRRFYEEHRPRGMVFRNPRTLFGHVLTHRQPLIANDVAHDPRSGGTPPGHPPLHRFLGLPIGQGDAMVGMVGLANRKGGYSEAFIDELRPIERFLHTVFENVALMQTRERALADLSAARVLQDRILRAVQTGIVALRGDGTVALANARAVALVPALSSEPPPPLAECLPNPDDAAWLHDALLAPREGPAAIRETMLHTLAGDAIPCEVQVAQILDESSSPTGFLVSITDVRGKLALKRSATLTASLQARLEELRQQQHDYEVISESVEFLQNSASIDEALELIFRATCRLFPQARVGAYASGEQENASSLFAASHPGELEPEVPHAQCWAMRIGRTHATWPGSHRALCRHGTATPSSARFCVPFFALQGRSVLLVVDDADVPAQDPARLEAKASQVSAMAQSFSGALSNLILRLKMEQAALIDPLTALPNRRAFHAEANRLLSRARRTGRPFALAMIDVDHFKRINDTLGHEGGDQVLRDLGAVLRAAIRASDLCARVGGEEFAVFFDEIPPEHAIARAERLRARVHAEVRYGERPVTVSIGLITSNNAPTTTSLDALYRGADAALYRAKSAGRDRVILATDEDLAARPDRPPTDRPPPSDAVEAPAPSDRSTRSGPRDAP